MVSPFLICPVISEYQVKENPHRKKLFQSFVWGSLIFYVLRVASPNIVEQCLLIIWYLVLNADSLY